METQPQQAPGMLVPFSDGTYEYSEIISTQTVTLTRELPGRTNPYLVAEVRPQATGIVKERLFTEGGSVKAGGRHAGKLGQEGHQLAHGDLLAGEEVGLSRAPSLGRPDVALGHVADINEIIAAVHVGRYLSLGEGHEELAHLRGTEVVGPDDARGADDDGVEAAPHALQDHQGGLGLGPPVLEGYPGRVESHGLIDGRAPRRLHQGVDGAGVDQPAHPALETGLHHIARAAHIHILEQAGLATRKGDHRGQVIDDIGSGEGPLQGLTVANVALDHLYIQAVQRPEALCRQHEAADRLTPGRQGPDEGVSDVAGGAGDNLHGDHLFEGN